MRRPSDSADSPLSNGTSTVIAARSGATRATVVVTDQSSPRSNARVTCTNAGNSTAVSSAREPAAPVRRRTSSSEPDSKRPSFIPVTSQPSLLTVIERGGLGKSSEIDSASGSTPLRRTVCAPGVSTTATVPSGSRPAASAGRSSTVTVLSCHRSPVPGIGTATSARALTCSETSRFSPRTVTCALVMSAQVGAQAGD